MSHFALGPCSSLLLFSMVNITTMTESTLTEEERGYLVCPSRSQSIIEKIRSRAQVGTEAETTEKFCSQVWSVVCSPLAMCIQARAIFLRNGFFHSWLGLPTLINNHNDFSRTWPRANLIWAIPQWKLLPR